MNRAPIAPELMNEARALMSLLAPKVNRFRTWQSNDGSLDIRYARNREVHQLLREITDGALNWYETHGEFEQADSLRIDVSNWIDAGLHNEPDFGNSRDSLRGPSNGDIVFFLAPLKTPNSVAPVGKRLEFFLALRKEPDALTELCESHPHPKNNCQSMLLIAGSDGYMLGNCLVVFPENVAARSQVARQSYAMFFYSKMRRIHDTYATPNACSLLVRDTIPRASSNLSPHNFYQARSIWGYLHDSMHYQGSWPFDEHIELKMNWFVGLLEEIKVDAKTVMECERGDIPYAHEQVDMLLLERVFRYPLAADSTQNFDSGTGVFLYSWLRDRGALSGDLADGLHFDRKRVIDALDDYVQTIEQLEKEVANAQDYKSRAKDLVRSYLLEGIEPGHRYRFSDDQLILLTHKVRISSGPPLRFAEAQW